MSSYVDWEVAQVTAQEAKAMSEVPMVTQTIEGDPMIEQATAFFHRMLDVIANATQLAKDVRELRHEVANLRAEVEEVHKRNMDLDQTIAAVRAENETLRSELAQTKYELTSVRSDKEYWESKTAIYLDDLTRLRDVHDNAVAEHNTNMDLAVETAAKLTAERDAAQKELAEIQRRFRELEGKVRGIVASLPGGVEEEKPASQDLVMQALGY